jgi:preprotein translocase subunit YajC
MKKYILFLVVGFLVLGAAFFWFGLQYGQKQMAKNNVNRLNRFGPGAGNLGQGNRVQGGLTSGEIISLDEKSLTVKLRDGGSKIVFFTENTPVTKSVSGSIKDLIAGDQVTITGSANQDGSISANNIQIRPTTTNPIQQ